MVSDVPDLWYFQCNNIFSGSIKNFNYKIIPDKEGLEVKVWYGKYCSDKSKIVDISKFEMSESGLTNLLRWLDSQHDIFCKNQISYNF